MNAEQKQQAKQLIADWTNASKTSTPAVWFLNGDCMAGFLQELVDADDKFKIGVLAAINAAAPNARHVEVDGHPVFFSKSGDDITDTHTLTPCPHCGGSGAAEDCAPPAPSVPDKTSCLSTGGMTVWGDSVSIEKCNNFVHLASQAAGFKDELINTRAELADVARDAERLRLFEQWAEMGYAPCLIYDDDGHWQVSFEGVSPVGERAAYVTSFADPSEWHDTVGEAIDAAAAAIAAEKGGAK